LGIDDYEKNGIKTYGVLVVIVIITCATFSGIYLIANSSKTMNLKQQATTKILQSGNLVSLDDNKKLIVTRNELHQSSTYLLSNDEFSLDMKISIANLIAKLSGNDLSVLYLIAIEIAKAFNAEIKPFHQGYLVYSGNDWAVLIEHNSFLVGLDDSAKLVNQLSKEFSTVFLGSCNSYIYSQFYNNVNGFRGNIQVEDVIKCLVEYLPYKTTIQNLLSSGLKNYELVYVETFTPRGIAKNVLTSLILKNSFLHLNPLLNAYVMDYMHIDLKPGSQVLPVGSEPGGNWGVAHINAKQEAIDGHINNAVIRNLMKGEGTRGFAFYDPVIDLWQGVIFKFKASFTTFELMAVLIGLPTRTQGPGMYDMYTIRSAEARRLTVKYPTQEDLVLYIERDKWNNRDWIKERFGYPVPVAIPQAAEALAALTVVELLGQDESDGYDGLLYGIPLSLWVFLLMSQITIAVAAVAVTVVVAALLALISGFVFPIISLLTIVAALLGAFILYTPEPQPITDPSYSYEISSVIEEPDEGSWSDYDEYDSIMEDVIETESANRFYDDDNDGLSNAFELNYFELYVEDYFGSEFAFIPDCPITDDFTEEDKYTWLDPNSDMDNDGLLTITEAIYNSNPFVADTDCDGLPDNEELEVLGTLQDQEVYLMDCDRDGDLDSQIVTIQEINYHSNPSAFDSDQDGLGDKQEELLDTLPLNPDTDGDTLLDGWEVYTYAIIWEDGPDEDYGYYEDFVDPLSPPMFPAWCDSDSDNDGLTNTEESRIFSNPYKADTDSDGLSDYLEYCNNLDPTNSNDAEHDHDEDGISTLVELTTYETNFLCNDTDQDGWTDEFEINTAGTNPNLNDTDADGILDGDEYNYWISIGVTTADAYDYCDDDDIDDDYLLDGLELAYGCDPLVRDTDSDGLWDGTEVLVHNTLPLVAAHTLRIRTMTITTMMAGKMDTKCILLERM